MFKRLTGQAVNHSCVFVSSLRLLTEKEHNVLAQTQETVLHFTSVICVKNDSQKRIQQEFEFDLRDELHLLIY